jgi:KipI family sensor histidine kinase inhibitor
MTTFDTPRITPLGASAFIAHFGDHIDRDLSQRIARLVEHLERQELPGVVDLVPSYTSVVVMFDVDRAELDAIADLVRHEWFDISDSPTSDETEGRQVDIPVVYGGEAGPDLDDVARATGMSPDEVIRRHSEAEYTVGALGFSPGFAFLIGLPTELARSASAARRRASTRCRRPAGGR